ncbi:hypothetical protein Salat_1488400 [Sesamum alatum]|uniref:Uncharacterized protein n=1 Tax=Sesamum alatum TaxID=300844 RepID=A0AAE1YBI0_9LAMI|nr:hypothetical protein Salat_1488400 [Sesamum alatum]
MEKARVSSVRSSGGKKSKEVMIETFEPQMVQDGPKAGSYLCGSTEHRMRDCPKCGKLNEMVAKQTDDEKETGQGRVGAMQMLTALQGQSQPCGKSGNPGLMMKLGLDAKPYDNRVKAVNMEVIPVSRVTKTELKLGSWKGQFIAGGSKPTFVKGESYKGNTSTHKKSKMVKAMPFRCSSSKGGAHSPRLFGLSCVGRMQEEMNKRWAEAQANDVDSYKQALLKKFQLGKKC